MPELANAHEEVVRWSTSLGRASMHELADRLSNRDTLDSGLAYHRAQAQDRPGKRHARKLVRLALKQQFPKGKRMSILTMPGVHWLFEASLLATREHGKGLERPRSTFITAFERNEYLYRAAMLTMPGHELERGIQIREAAPYSSCSVRTSNVGRFHRCTFEDLAAWYVAQDEFGFDAAWLDFSGLLTPDLVALVADFFARNIRDCLVVTWMNARGSDDGASLLRLGRVVMDHGYCDTVPMRQIGIIK